MLQRAVTWAMGGSRDGQWGVCAADLADHRAGVLEIRVRSGRIELGPAAAGRLRVRWSVPKVLPVKLSIRRWREPRLRWDAGVLRVGARRARLRIEVPAGFSVRVHLASGEITSWGAGGDLDLVSRSGSVSCRELTARTVVARATRISLHFASPPDRVEARGSQIIVALPGGPYSVEAPPGAEVTVPQTSRTSQQTPCGQIVVAGADVRVLAAGTPLVLTGEPDVGG